MKEIREILIKYKSHAGENKAKKAIKELEGILKISSKDLRGYENKVEYLANEFHSCANSTILNLLGKSKSYNEVLQDTCEHLKIKPIPKTIVQKEKVILEVFLEEIINSLDDDQKDALQDEIIKAAKKDNIDKETITKFAKSALTPTTILAIGAGGFGTYVAATSTLYAIGSAIGVTFGFSIYTGLTSVISAFAGPIGWAISALLAGYFLGQPNYSKKIIPFIIYIVKIRSEIKG